MSLKYKVLEAITEQDISDLVANQVKESRNIEYKQQINHTLKQDKVDLLAGVASFANTNGGDIVFGIEEDRNTGLPVKVCGVAIANEDQLIRDLENIFQYGLDPRLPYIRFRSIPLSTGTGYVFIVRVGLSFAGPHMITFDQLTRFYARNSKGKYIMDVNQVRTAFDLFGTLTERSRKIRDERLSKIRTGDSIISMPEGAKIVLHIIPFTAFEPGSSSLDVSMFLRQHTTLTRPISTTARSERRLNFDGYLSYAVVEGTPPYKTDSYLQIFRNGIIEAVDSANLHILGDGKRITTSYEKFVVETLRGYYQLLNQLSIMPPYFVLLSLINVKNYRVLGGSHPTSESIEQQDLILPELIIENSPQNDNDIAVQLRPVFDVVWNAGAKPSSPNFDKDGNWKPVN